MQADADHFTGTEVGEPEASLPHREEDVRREEPMERVDRFAPRDRDRRPQVVPRSRVQAQDPQPALFGRVVLCEPQHALRISHLPVALDRHAEEHAAGRVGPHQHIGVSSLR
jgi:hypothetical protein